MPTSRRLRYDQVLGLLLISPWLVGLVFFKVLPILASLGISLTDFYMLAPEETEFIGLANYVRVLHDEAVGVRLFLTLSPMITDLPLQIVAALLLAACLNSRRLRGKTLMRTLFFVPSVIPSVAIVFMWLGFANENTGWLNRLILQPLGLTGGVFGDLYSGGATQLLFTVSALWSIGPGMLIMLGAIQGVPPEIHEAARVDGAGPVERFFFISLPLISPAIFFTLVINLITVFGGVILLDRGNTFSGGGSAYDQYISHMMFSEFELGYASSLAWVFFLVVMVLILVLFSTSRRWVYYADREG
jgi:multiple sugar transport system permease protein